MSHKIKDKNPGAGELAELNIVRFDLTDSNLSKKDILTLEQELMPGLNHEKYFSLICVNDYLKLKSELKEYLISEERSWKLAGEAVVIKSFAQKLMVDFYFQFNLPLVPTKTFTQQHEALNWLERLA